MISQTNSQKLLALVMEARRLEQHFESISGPDSGATIQQEGQAWDDYQAALHDLFQFAEELDAEQQAAKP